MTKLEQVLPSRLRHRVAALEAVTVPPSAARSTVDPTTLTAVAAACRDHQRLRFDYRAHDGTASLRAVEPHRVVHTGRRWYLVAWDTGRADWRTFRLDRMEPPRTPTGPRFTPREAPGREVGEFASWAVSTAAYRYRARITLHVPLEVAADVVTPTSGLLEAVDERSCTLYTGSQSLDALAVHVAVLGWDFEVHEPPELVEHVRILAARLARAVTP